MKYTTEELLLFKQLIGQLMLDYGYNSEPTGVWTHGEPTDLKVLGREFTHEFSNPFETAVWNFRTWRLGRSGNHSARSALNDMTLVFNTELDQLDKVIEKLAFGEPTDLPLTASIDMFLSLNCLHHRRVPTTRSAFSLEDKLQRLSGNEKASERDIREAQKSLTYIPVMDAFAAAGFAIRLKGKYKWTLKIAEYMQRNYAWTESNQCLRELEAEEFEAKALAIWNTLPSAYSEYFYRHPKDERKSAFITLLLLYWNELDGRWEPEKLETPQCGDFPRIATVLEQKGLLR